MRPLRRASASLESVATPEGSSPRSAVTTCAGRRVHTFGEEGGRGWWGT